MSQNVSDNSHRSQT